MEKHSGNIVLNNTVYQLLLPDIQVYRTLHPTIAECITFSSAYDTLSSIEYMIGHKTSVNIFKTPIWLLLKKQIWKQNKNWLLKDIKKLECLSIPGGNGTSLANVENDTALTKKHK